MKKSVIFLFLITNFIFAQDKITKNLGDFNVLKTYRGLTVDLVKADRPQIVIEGDKSKEVIVKNVNGVLKISMSVMETFSASDARVTIYYSETLNLIDANEGSFISSEEIFKQEKLELKAQEAAQINLKINTDYLDIKVISGALIELDGFSKNQDVVSNTGGIYKGENLDSDYANITASTGGIATIKAEKLVDANAKLGATITVIGEPGEVKKRESVGGYVRH